MKTLIQKYADLYPIWGVIATIMALMQPATFAWFNGSCITWAMSVVLLGMGFTLKGEDFLRIFKMPGSLALGFLAHYLIMPLTVLVLAQVLHLSPSFVSRRVSIEVGMQNGGMAAVLARKNFPRTHSPQCLLYLAGWFKHLWAVYWPPSGERGRLMIGVV